MIKSAKLKIVIEVKRIVHYVIVIELIHLFVIVFKVLGKTKLKIVSNVITNAKSVKKMFLHVQFV